VVCVCDGVDSLGCVQISHVAGKFDWKKYFRLFIVSYMFTFFFLYSVINFSYALYKENFGFLDKHRTYGLVVTANFTGVVLLLLYGFSSINLKIWQGRKVWLQNVWLRYGELRIYIHHDRSVNYSCISHLWAAYIHHDQSVINLCIHISHHDRSANVYVYVYITLRYGELHIYIHHDRSVNYLCIYITLRCVG